MVPNIYIYLGVLVQGKKRRKSSAKSSDCLRVKTRLRNSSQKMFFALPTHHNPAHHSSLLASEHHHQKVGPTSFILLQKHPLGMCSTRVWTAWAWKEVHCYGAALMSRLDSTLPPSLTASRSHSQFEWGLIEGWRFWRLLPFLKGLSG